MAKKNEPATPALPAPPPPPPPAAIAPEPPPAPATPPPAVDDPRDALIAQLRAANRSLQTQLQETEIACRYLDSMLQRAAAAPANGAPRDPRSPGWVFWKDNDKTQRVVAFGSSEGTARASLPAGEYTFRGRL